VSEPRRRFELQTLKADFFKALGHPTRVRILEMLRHGTRSVQDLQQALALDQSIVLSRQQSALAVTASAAPFAASAAHSAALSAAFCGPMLADPTVLRQSPPGVCIIFQ